MKKLVTLAAAALCGAAFAGEGIQSANIVGYANKDLRQGFKMMTAMFSSINKEGIKLSDLTVTGYPEYKDYAGGTGAEVYIKVLDCNGACAKDKDGNDMAYYYYDEMMVNDVYKTGKGWYNRNATQKFDGEIVDFVAGEGLWVAGKNGYNLNFLTPIAFD